MLTQCSQNLPLSPITVTIQENYIFKKKIKEDDGVVIETKQVTNGYIDVIKDIYNMVLVITRMRIMEREIVPVPITIDLINHGSVLSTCIN